MGDSISTYTGYSNDATNTNSNIGSNAICYTGTNLGVTSVNQTWWKQTADLSGMNILVNNSYSGDKVTSLGTTRCTELHDNTGANAGTNPDIIAVYLGINDFDGSITYENFASAYDTMIQKIVNKYNSSRDTATSTDTTATTTADIYLLNLLPNGVKIDNTRLANFNKVISDTATKYGCTLVDLYNDSGITRSNMASYMGDSSCLHPNPAGMTLMAECFLDTLYNNYVTDKE